MITQQESELIFTHAYVPEHLVDYVMSVSGAEAHLFGHFLCYKREGVLIFIGYPLGEAFDQNRMEFSLEEAVRALKPRVISFIAPTMSTGPFKVMQRGSDSYYRLELNASSAPPGVRNMVRRASRELSVEAGKAWNEENVSLIAEFLASHRVPEETQRIFERIPDYLATSHTALILSARNLKGSLVAFNVADYGSKDYSFYMFSFTSRDHYVPGASDLLLSEVIALSRRKEKKFVNLGLAIHEGIAFFKKKWGGLPFLIHEYALYETSRAGIIDLLLSRI